MLKCTLNTSVNNKPSFSTVNKAEVQKFSDKASEWWDPSGEFSMLQLLNPPRVSYVRDQLFGVDSEATKSGIPFKGIRMLDIGCGGGLLSESLVRLGGNVVGVDASYDNIQMAKLHARKDPVLWRGPGKIEYRNSTAEEMLMSGELFDVVLAMEIIEHVDQPLEFLRTCAQLTRPGGDLFLSTMSRTPAAYVLTVLLAEKVLGMVHDGTHDWYKYIKSQELKDAIESFGDDWEVKDIRGILWNPLSREWKVAERNGIVGIGGYESLEVNYIMRASKRLK
ncbi:bifunctional 3-demethylubiquinone-9 3-methyltransferase/ 2-octaprenyl-6-hydroxy phenol methylase [Cokeromyces recurvatus]|uniref:bifunctional 3-demethylubiquinone-9 3-methyltransferase/ 2-octaprenyl-6-hydroxy phenol methylase n=1 Tax=Cokeromyces recurvatus TaxID=90255 RepID=UPI00221E8923|nr:bifunctional 3-demethylubiquinone-9 3-methyltransferase/ 2-octaprenyl-6-hydroxy phenol methylase [Cokeromyces recurvatus]KAI7906124.1 bifunctional 3-demethylubiquinone-9 3-methyltransferase/ 2-octaprenyl-6-hydroxy phenol methylase [Cokeromyces recurvatus]